MIKELPVLNNGLSVLNNQIEKENPHALSDFADGVKGFDHKPMFGERSKENEEGLKQNIIIKETKKINEESE